MGQATTLSLEVWNSLPEKDRGKRPALPVEDTFDGKMTGDAWTLIAEKVGYEIALRVSMGLGGKDLTNAKAGDVDAILFLGNMPEAVTPMRQTKENKFNEPTEPRPFHLQQT